MDYCGVGDDTLSRVIAEDNDLVPNQHIQTMGRPKTPTTTLPMPTAGAATIMRLEHHPREGLRSRPKLKNWPLRKKGGGEKLRKLRKRIVARGIRGERRMARASNQNAQARSRKAAITGAKALVMEQIEINARKEMRVTKESENRASKIIHVVQRWETDRVHRTSTHTKIPTISDSVSLPPRPSR